jgi:hypothetical protein
MVPFGLNQAMIEEKSRAILATLVGAIAVAKSIPNEVEIRRILTIAQNQVLTILGVAELAVGSSFFEVKEQPQ